MCLIVLKLSFKNQLNKSYQKEALYYEHFQVLLDYNSCSYSVPKSMSKESLCNFVKSRKDPGKQVVREIDIGTKLWCKRAMMQVIFLAALFFFFLE